ncbi:MAG: DUF3084 domain-containing protein [Selenomonadaceae bacterium]|nr:DUF3084 domain-containing protein [Selenomonadaceae bacterium]
MYGVLFIAVLVVSGGVIAFVGDRLGTKIGKKRLSIFGLRPRHTSMVITVFTGIFITTLTFGIMAAASENVRTALFGLDQLHQEMIMTQNNLDKVSGELATAQAEQGRAAKELIQSLEEISLLEDKQAELLAESEKLQAGNLALEAANSELSQRNDELTIRNGDLEGENTALTDRNAELTASNQSLEKRAADLREGLISMREGNIAFQAGEVIAGGVVQGGKSFDDTARELGALAQLAKRNVATRLGTETGGDIWIYPPEYEAALETIRGSSQDVVVRIVAAGNLLRGEAVRTNIELYPNSLIYKKNEFILSRVYKMTGNDGALAERAVMDFLKEVNQDAKSRGVLPDPIRKSVGVMDGNQYYQIVQSLIPIKGTVKLSAYAEEDTDVLGPLRLMMKMEELTSLGK